MFLNCESIDEVSRILKAMETSWRVCGGRYRSLRRPSAAAAHAPSAPARRMCRWLISTRRALTGHLVTDRRSRPAVVSVDRTAHRSITLLGNASRFFPTTVIYQAPSSSISSATLLWSRRTSALVFDTAVNIKREICTSTSSSRVVSSDHMSEFVGVDEFRRTTNRCIHRFVSIVLSSMTVLLNTTVNSCWNTRGSLRLATFHTFNSVPVFCDLLPMTYIAVCPIVFFRSVTIRYNRIANWRRKAFGASTRLLGLL